MSEKTEKFTYLHVRLPVSLLGELRDLAYGQEMTITALARRTIRIYVESSRCGPRTLPVIPEVNV